MLALEPATDEKNKTEMNNRGFFMSMRNMFKGFYTGNIKDNHDIYKASDTLFVFDTNVILDLYRNNQETISAIKTSIEQISGNIYLPYFTALEYQRRRLGVIDDQKHLISTTTSPVVDLLSYSSKLLEKCNNSKARHYEGLNRQVSELMKKSIDLLNSGLEDMYGKLNESIDELNTKDIHREWIDNIFSGKIGVKKDQEYIKRLDAECKSRYELKTPPGFCDADKVGKPENIFSYDGITYQRAYGDFYIWKETLEYAGAIGAKNVFLITNDAKDDFIFKVGRDKENRESKGVHAILREEMLNNSNVQFFDVINTKELISNINNAFDLKINTENLNISTGNGYGAGSNTSNSERRALLENRITREKTEIAGLSKKAESATDPEIKAKIRLIIKGKLSSIQKMSTMLSSIQE